MTKRKEMRRPVTDCLVCWLCGTSAQSPWRRRQETSVTRVAHLYQGQAWIPEMLITSSCCISCPSQCHGPEEGLSSRYAWKTQQHHYSLGFQFSPMSRRQGFPNKDNKIRPHPKR